VWGRLGNITRDIRARLALLQEEDELRHVPEVDVREELDTDLDSGHGTGDSGQGRGGEVYSLAVMRPEADVSMRRDRKRTGGGLLLPLSRVVSCPLAPPAACSSPDPTAYVVPVPVPVLRTSWEMTPRTRWGRPSMMSSTPILTTYRNFQAGNEQKSEMVHNR
jgi:hypothetical protein